MTILCEIVSQDRSLFDEHTEAKKGLSNAVDMVILPGMDGEMGIMPNHAPLLSTLKMGVVRVRRGEEELVFTVTGGLVEVQPTIVTVLADSAEHLDEIDIARAEAAKQRAEELLADGPPDDLDAYLAIEAALRRSNLRLDVARRYRSGRGQLVQRDYSRSDEETK